MLLIEKYTPTIQSFFNKDVIEMLRSFSNDKNIPHLLFYGNEGVGKKSLIKMFLTLLFGENVNNLKNVEYKIKGSGNKLSNVIIEKSDYHIVITPNSNNFDRYIIQNIVKEYAKRIPLETFKVKKPFKVVVINTIDNLSYYAQTSLRRTMEKYSDTCRFISWCSSISKVIEPIQSRCLCIRIKSPSINEMVKFVLNVSYNEKIKMNLEELNDIIDKSNFNPKKALWILEYKKQNIIYNEPFMDIIVKIVELLKFNVNNILEIREKLYNIIITNYNSDEIIKEIVFLLCKKDISDKKKEQIINIGLLFMSRLNKCRREIIQLEAFIISVIKTLL